MLYLGIPKNKFVRKNTNKLIASKKLFVIVKTKIVQFCTYWLKFVH